MIFLVIGFGALFCGQPVLAGLSFIAGAIFISKYEC
jgi:hypothetical protein